MIGRSLYYFVILLLLASPANLFSASFSIVHSETEISLIGFTRPVTVMEISSEISGRCIEVDADEGEPIPLTGTFAHIDPTFISMELETNRLNIKQADRQLQFEQKEVERFSHLVSKNSLSQIQLDEQLLRRDQARNKLELLKVKSKYLKENLVRHTVAAPANWLTSERFVEPGEWVQAGQILARIGDFRQLIVPLALTQNELRSLEKTKSKIPLTLVDTNDSGSGNLHSIHPDFDPVTRKINVEVKIDMNTIPVDYSSRGGIPIQVFIKTPDPTGSFLVPEQAISQRYEEQWLTREDGKTLRVIVLGPENNALSHDLKQIRVSSPEITEGEIFLIPEKHPNNN